MIQKEKYLNLAEILNNTVASNPNKIAVYFNEKKITYRNLSFASDRFAQGLKNLGIRKGSRVAIFLSNSPEFIIAYFGIIKAGLSVVPINNMFKEEETRYLCDDACVVTVVTSLSYIDIIRPIKENSSTLKHIILTDGITCDALNFYEIIERTTTRFKRTKIDRDVVASILYTSGTTGKPKGAMLTHDNFISNSSICSKTIGVKKSDNFICFLPMFHSFAWTTCVLMPLYSGASITIIDSLRSFRKIIRNVIKKKVTIFVGIPSVYHILAQMHIPPIFSSRILKMIDPLRLCISGAAALSSEVLDAFQNKFKVSLLEGYGLTEASPVVSLNPLKGVRKPGSVGLPLRGVEVKVVNDNGHDLPQGEVGELIVRGPNIMKGYLGNEQATRVTVKNSWLYTGDLARLDKDGYIYIVDRKKEMINVRGLNVYPAEIEKILLQHPQIKEAAVVRVADKFKGEVPKAFVVLQEGQGLKRQQIIAYLRKHLAGFKIPKFIEFREGLPKTAIGKIAKRELA